MHTTTAPSREELIGRATELVPVLSKNALWQEENRVLHQDTIDALTESGLLRLTLPARYGGYEADTTTVVDVMSELALGDGAASWVGTVWTISTWLTGLFPDHVQDEVFGSGDVRISGTFAPSAVGVPTAGGIVLNGRWGFNSAAPQSTWNAHAAVRVVEGRQPEPIVVLVPMSDLEVIDDWHASGMRGSGSVTTVAKDVFVPDARVLPMMPVLLEGRHSSELNAKSPLWQIPFLPWASAVTTGTHHGQRGAGGGWKMPSGSFGSPSLLPKMPISRSTRHKHKKDIPLPIRGQAASSRRRPQPRPPGFFMYVVGR